MTKPTEETAMRLEIGAEKKRNKGNPKGEI